MNWSGRTDLTDCPQAVSLKTRSKLNTGSELGTRGLTSGRPQKGPCQLTLPDRYMSFLEGLLTTVNFVSTGEKCAPEIVFLV